MPKKGNGALTVALARPGWYWAGPGQAAVAWKTPWRSP